MEPKFIRPVSNHAPSIQQNDAYSDDIEHRLGRYLIPFLDIPEGKDAQRLRRNTHNEQVCERQSVVGDDRILERGDDSDCRVQRVTEQEISNQICKRLLELPDLGKGTPLMQSSRISICL